MSETLTPRERVISDLSECLGRAGGTVPDLEKMGAMELISLIAPNGITFKTVSQIPLPRVGQRWFGPVGVAVAVTRVSEDSVTVRHFESGSEQSYTTKDFYSIFKR